MAGRSDAGGSREDSWVIANEFAGVRIRVDRTGHDPRLVVEDLSGEARILLDALTLASLARERPDRLACHLFPGDPDGEGSD
ncbi:hypothetical protein [Azospirillum sp. ST 5-10]|uniref:hypothetical protein n=1 Tax=unclassified Azospirillum TaxID=2630922 RepID=UPI003F4A1EDA